MDEELLKKRLKFVRRAKQDQRESSMQLLTDMFVRRGWTLDYFDNGEIRATLSHAERTARCRFVEKIHPGSFIWSATLTAAGELICYWWPVPGPVVETNDPQYHLETYKDLCKTNRLCG